MQERTDGWTGYAGTGGRLTIVSGQEGGHRAPDAFRERQTTGQRKRSTMEREATATVPCPSDACNAISRRAVCLCGRAFHLRHCSSPFSHTKVNIPVIRMEYNAILPGRNRLGTCIARVYTPVSFDLSIAGKDTCTLLYGETATFLYTLIVPPYEKRTSISPNRSAFCVTFESFMLPWV